MCGSCHGPTYRDWEAGVHGRTSGYWDRSLGPMDRKACVNCHNPHAPHFPGRPPAPGPHPLRANPTALTEAENHPGRLTWPRPIQTSTSTIFLGTSAVLTTGLAALAASLKPLLPMNDFPTMERFLQKHYKEMTPQEKSDRTGAHPPRGEKRCTCGPRPCFAALGRR